MAFDICDKCNKGKGTWVSYAEDKDKVRITPPCVCDVCPACIRGSTPVKGFHISPGSHGRVHEIECLKVRPLAFRNRPMIHERILTIEAELGIKYEEIV